MNVECRNCDESGELHDLASRDYDDEIVLAQGRTEGNPVAYCRVCGEQLNKRALRAVFHDSRDVYFVA